ncbi:MAG: 2-succinyl-5-enolpyruvyl-6-hydroxy-3-cyclohexene-1-carboxylic-acid synthase [Actinobacteria bacterium]|nr:2-succinyl-5-enolpyruvyl-6-hydroxy-3-cyclohexene-1-carboxylic-acid synthase [Actinomycetota bacterium]
MKAANPSHALALVLVDELVRNGIEHACLAPGSRSAALAIALADDERISLHVVHDERSAAFLALGIARSTRRPVPVVSTSGSAAANFYPAVIEAAHGRVPLIVLTADRPPELRATGANQTTDQIKLYGDLVRWFHEMGTPEAGAGAPRYWRSVVCRTIAEATLPVPGPVHLNLAFREPLVPDETGDDFPFDLSGRPNGAPWTASAGSNLPSPAIVGRTSAQVERAERGLVVAGGGTTDPAAAVLLAEAAGWPLLAEAQSGARTGPNAISTYDALLRSEVFASEPPDLVIRVGRTGTSKALARYLSDAIEQITIDPAPFETDPERTSSAAIATDPGLLLRAVAGGLGPRPPGRWIQRWREGERIARGVIDDALAGDLITEPRTARDLARSIPSGGTLVVASSMPVRDLDSFMAPRSGLRIVANRGTSGIDGFVSTALGVALASDGPVVALAGDLSLLHDQNGFLLLSSEPVDLTIVVINNDGGGIFSFLPQARYEETFEQVFGTPHGLDLAKLAAVYGIDHRPISAPSDLPSAVAEPHTGVRILEVQTDRKANLEFHQELVEKVIGALV